jgi:hypothetical protein
MNMLQEQIIQTQNKPPGEYVGKVVLENVGFSIHTMKAVLKASPGQIGLTGGKFFTLTYSFLGQVIMSVFIYEL